MQWTMQRSSTTTFSRNLRNISYLHRRTMSALTKVQGQGKGPVRLVLFDVFDTLCTPRLPIHEHYYAEAISGGLSPETISPASVRSAFRPAFKTLDSKYPLYGKLSQPSIQPEEWWTKIIYETLLEAGANRNELDKRINVIAPNLLERFESEKGYQNFPETISTLQSLKEMGIKVSVVSNADPRILKTLSALGITSLLSYTPTLSWQVEASKPSPIIYNAACNSCDELPSEGVIMIGDELKADYRGALEAGLDARLVRREGDWSDGAARQAKEDLDGVHVIRSLQEVVDEVRRRNQSLS